MYNSTYVVDLMLLTAYPYTRCEDSYFTVRDPRLLKVDPYTIAWTLRKNIDSGEYFIFRAHVLMSSTE